MQDAYKRSDSTPMQATVAARPRSGSWTVVQGDAVPRGRFDDRVFGCLVVMASVKL
jgi:hypothetical protein